MRITNTSKSVSPTQQMFVWNRIRGESQLGDPGTDFAGSIFTKLIGIFTKDPYRDIHINAQNMAVDSFGTVLRTLDAKAASGNLTESDLESGRASITKTMNDFRDFTNQLASKYPQDADRFYAGQKEVLSLGNQLLEGMNSNNPKFASAQGTGGSFNAITSGITKIFSSPNGGINPMLLAGAAFFLLPRLFKGK